MSFNKQKHIRYWRMCANILPDAYQSSDASRMFLGFFIISALDLLDVLHNNDSNLEKPIVTAAEREKWTDWIYSCQLPNGAGFRGFPGTDLADARNPGNEQWDPGNLPNTFFALAALLVLGDDLGRVKRWECLAWLPRLQREDGSFGEILGPGGTVEGGRDLRYCCCAAGIAYILRDSAVEAVFDEMKLVDYILSCQDYTGGFGESQLREPHSGLNYCAVGTLQFLKRLGGPACARAGEALRGQDACVRWLLERQTSYIEDEDFEEEEGAEGGNEHVSGSIVGNGLDSNVQDTAVIGFNGRDNKIADTCYCFWNSGALAMLDSLHLANIYPVREYLLTKVQHMIGGFAKGPDSPPDVMHSYLGLAALSLYGEDGVKSLDPALCISKNAAANLQNVAWRRAT